jgi:hypothetical protein
MGKGTRKIKRPALLQKIDSCRACRLMCCSVSVSTPKGRRVLSMRAMILDMWVVSLPEETRYL